mmetsp:Transcript_14436/g.30770  ORF Transcript_14436/g.30770 Transcript_14436/m.30770 type:complete len:111 (+) Transcript_14436:682-1014(+)
MNFDISRRYGIQFYYRSFCKGLFRQMNGSSKICHQIVSFELIGIPMDRWQSRQSRQNSQKKDDDRIKAADDSPCRHYVRNFARVSSNTKSAADNVYYVVSNNIDVGIAGN